MNILVATASRHGSTSEIGDTIATVLREAGHTVDELTIENRGHIGQYDAAIIGSAIYMGNWLPEARSFVQHNRVALSEMPVWLFSSGPIGSSSPGVDTERLEEMMDIAGVRDHRVFAGKLDKHGLGFTERLAVRAVKAMEGDFRNWDDVRAWAHGIHLALTPTAVSVL